MPIRIPRATTEEPIEMLATKIALYSFLTVFLLVQTLVMSSIHASSSMAPGFLSTKGTWIVDPNGKTIFLRGVNFPGYTKPRMTMHSEADYRELARLGFNVVRLPVSWENFEPTVGKFEMSYLAHYVAKDVQWAKRYGLYIVLDMHQFKWARRFADNGGGIPEWAVRQYAPSEAGMLQAISNFWANSSLQDHLINVWFRIAQYFANESAIAGYDILNEPQHLMAPTPVEQFYIRTISAIRSVDPNHIIILEPANVYIDPSKFPMRDNIVWSPHFYPLSFFPTYMHENIAVLRADIEHKSKRYLDAGVPLWIGEFGAFMKDGTAQNWLQDAKGLFEEYQVGWAWWAYYGNAPQSVPSALVLNG